MEQGVESSRGQRKEKIGIVVSDKMHKTVVVNVKRTCKHPKYHKVITLTKKYHVHDDSNELKNGDKVQIKECRPYSKKKRWLVVKKIEGNTRKSES